MHVKSNLTLVFPSFVGHITGTTMGEKKKNPHAVALAALGAKKGGEARAMALSPEQRREIARKAARARWAKVRKRGKRNELWRGSGTATMRFDGSCLAGVRCLCRPARDSEIRCASQPQPVSPSRKKEYKSRLSVYHLMLGIRFNLLKCLQSNSKSSDQESFPNVAST